MNGEKAPYGVVHYDGIDLYHGECLAVMDKLKDKSIDLIIIDPPYNISKDKNWDCFKSVDVYVEFMAKVFAQCERLLKNNGSFYFFHNDFLQMVELQNWLNKESKFKFKSLITVSKNNSFIKQLYGSRNQFRNYINLNEYLLYYTFQEEPALEPFDSYLNYMTNEKTKLGWSIAQFNEFLGYKAIAFHWFWKNGNDLIQTQPRFISEGDYGKLQSTGFFKKDYSTLKDEYNSLRVVFNEGLGEFNHWDFDFKPNNRYKHPTQKPIALIEKIIKASSNSNQTILDCFMGSGTTCVASINTNRKCIGIEMDDKYFEIATQRVSDAINTKASQLF